MLLTERFLRRNGRWIKLLTGLRPEEFWPIFEAIEEDYPAYERERLSRPDRKRAIGAGRPFAHPLLLRVVACLCYLRLHLSQELTAALFGMHQSDISRDLRRLLPLLQRHLPLPVLLPLEATEAELKELEALIQTLLAGDVALLDTTEQPIERPQEDERQREYYSGKRKRHTVKTQVLGNRQREVVAITPAVKGKTADIEIARRSQVVKVLPEGTESYQDKGYVGLEKEVPLIPSPFSAHCVSAAAAQTTGDAPRPRIVLHTPTKKPRGGTLSPEQKERNRQIGRIRVIVEHIIGHLKNWRMLAERFRCALSIYTAVFLTIAGLLNFQRRVRRQRAAV